MPEPLKAIVFDLDGTLVETAADIHAILVEIMAAEDLAAPPLPAVRGMIGDGARVLIERALAAVDQPADPARVDLLHGRFRDRYAEVPCRWSEIYPGGRELLADLAARGLRLGMCTNKPQAATDGLLTALGIAEFFGSVVGGDSTPVRKPDPGHLAVVLDQLATPPAAAVMVGDSRNDLVTARGLGVPCILVSYGYTNVAARDLGADAVIDRLDQLPAALARLPRTSPGRRAAG